MQHLADSGVPLTLETIAAELKVSEPQDLTALQRRLGAMERDGQVIRNRRGGYCLLHKSDLVRGRVVGHPDGFGFLKPEDGTDDLFLSPRQMRSLLHGDRVVVRVAGVDSRGRREASLVEVLERQNEQVVGRFFLEGGVGFVVPNNRRIHQDIVVPPGNRNDAQHGQIAVVEILQQPSTHSQPVGRVIEVLGDHMAPGMEIDIAIRSYGLPREWPEDVVREVKRFGEHVPEDAMKDRQDLRNLPLVTIDGEDARDFDDAVYCEPHGKGWRLVVAIADVSSYVHVGSTLNAEARERGNSVYFPESVIPMLPEVLSNGLCSLNPEVDRLCMACEMFFSPAGKMHRYRFFEGVMRSHARLTYSQTAAMLVDGDKKLQKKYKSVWPNLGALYRLYEKLAEARRRRGAIDFDTTETRIVFGKERKIERIVPVQRNDAHKLIEECMIAANIAAADFLTDRKLPTLYRIHEGPSADKITDLRAFLAEFGLSLGGGDNPAPKHFARLLESVRSRPDAHLIQTVMLRSLRQAVYSPDNIGHFGLAFDAYVHFTSPIRRYPDLLVHRAIRHALAHRPRPEFQYTKEDMRVLGEHASMTERRADEATRDAVDWLKCEYMMDKVGGEFDGIVSGVTSFGLFVELDEIYAEGLVHVTALKNDYYHFDPIKHWLTGERLGAVYRLGDKVRVRVLRVDLDERKIDFELVEPAAGRRGRKGRKKTAGKTTRRKTKARTRSPRRRGQR